MVTTVIRIETAAHFTHRGDDFVWTLLRIDRPDQRLLAESFVCQFRQWIVDSCDARGLVQLSNKIVATVSNKKLCWFVAAWANGNSGGLSELRRNNTRDTVRRDLYNSRSIELSDIEKVIVR